MRKISVGYGALAPACLNPKEVSLVWRVCVASCNETKRAVGEVVDVVLVIVVIHAGLIRLAAINLTDALDVHGAGANV